MVGKIHHFKTTNRQVRTKGLNGLWLKIKRSSSMLKLKIMCHPSMLSTALILSILSQINPKISLRSNKTINLLLVGNKAAKIMGRFSRNSNFLQTTHFQMVKV